MYTTIHVPKIAVQRLRSFCIRRSVRRCNSNGRGREVFASTDHQLSFSRSRIGEFFQTAPRLENQYTSDHPLQSYMKRVVPTEVLEAVFMDLNQFGDQVAGEINDLGRQVELEPPQLEQYDAWGKRVDRLKTSPAWKKLRDIAAKEGLVEIAFSRLYGPWSRVYQVIKLYLFAPSSGLYSCPLAMTDGAAKVIESSGNMMVFHRAYGHLTSRDPTEFWTSGQWMTERKGGSDVGLGTETVAVHQPDGRYRLYGYKWFSSASDADMSLTLARITDADGRVAEGSQGLSLFYLETRGKHGDLNSIQIQRLKNKLGTRQLPTAELLLDGTLAHKLSDDGRGVATISDMLNITRLHNSLNAVGGMRRMINLAQNYCIHREVFGKKLVHHPLHIQTLARLEIECRGALYLVLELSRLLGLEETNEANEEDQLLLRLLMPVTKLYTAKQAMLVASEGLESFGGQGYIEDTGLPGMLRDAQVLPIWEGTTNVLSLDVLRVLHKTQGKAVRVYVADIKRRLSLAEGNADLQSACRAVSIAANVLMEFTVNSANSELAVLEMAARDYSFSLARIYIGALLIEHAAWVESLSTDVYTAQRWCKKQLNVVTERFASGFYNSESQILERDILFN